MGGDAGLHGPTEALPQMEPVSDLQGIGGAAACTLGVGAGSVPADDLHAGWRISRAGGGPASRVGSTSITRWSSTLVKTVE
ncbi:hypothetical protein ADK51_14270 [Streptomyces sp. WM6368]|nr:hypothetical protein ADK51_14270 [Streptomyces sp. WM6368]